MHGRDHVHQKGDELQVFRGGLSRREQVDARVGAQRPVVVLARSVDPLKGLLVQQDAEMVAARDFVHDRHQQLVVVVGLIDGFVDGRQLELVGRHLVVAGLDRNAQLQTLVLQVAHEGDDAGRDGSEVVVLELLVLGRFVTHQRAAREHQVGTQGPEAFVHQEILLLPAQEGVDASDVLVEIAAHLRRRPVDGGQRPQQRGLVVQCFARVGDEDGGDAEGRVDDEGGRCRIPGRITTRLEGVADAAVGE